MIQGTGMVKSSGNTHQDDRATHIKEERIMRNIPEVKLGMIAVSRDCFLISLSDLE